MALLNQLIAEKDLASMSRDQIDFLADRIDNILNDADIQRQIAKKLGKSVEFVSPTAKFEIQGRKRG